MRYTFYRLCSLLVIAALPFTGFSQEKDSAHQLETVVVTGQYLPQSLKQSVYKVKVIGPEIIKQRGATNIAGVLNMEAGVRFSNDGALGESDISLIGMNGRGVKILLDGIPLVDRNDYRQSLSQIDINSVERIEIIEGPMSTVYGSDAMAGVINIITKKIKKGSPNLTVNARVQEESTGEYYSPFADDGVHLQNIGINWSNSKWNLGGSFTRNNFGGFMGDADINSAYRRSNDWKPKDQDLASCSIGFRNNEFNILYRLDYLHENIYAAGPLLQSVYKARDQYFITDRYTHQLQAEWQINNKLRWTNSASYQDFKRATETYVINYLNDTKSPSNDDATAWDVAKFRTYFFRSTMQWFPSSKFSLQPGVEIRSDRSAGQRIESNDGITDYSLFISAEYKPVAKLKIRPGVRFNHNSIYDAPPAIPSLNIKYDLDNRLDMRFSYGYGFRAPQLRELYFDFVDANHNIKGNKDLKAESSNSFNASLNWNVPVKGNVQLLSSLSGFYNTFNDMITFAQSGSTFTYFNIAEYKTTGVSLENTFSWKALHATLNFAYIGRYNQLTDDPSFKSDDLPQFTWSPEASSNVTYNIKKVKGSIGLFYKFTGSLPNYDYAFNPATNKNEVYLSKVESFHMADITASKNLFRYFTLQAGIKNIFDVERLQNSNTTTGSVHSAGGSVMAGYGRSYFIGLNFQWSKK